jgi:hypothetical protein
MRSCCQNKDGAQVMVMPANHVSRKLREIHARHPGRIGHLFSPGCGCFAMSLPYALDNGAWSAHKNNREWDQQAWYRHLSWSERREDAPIWIVVPDVVGSRDETLRKWERYSKIAADFGPLAIAVQNGMTKADIPSDAEVIFVGGSRDWKRATAPYWTHHFARVHVGRVTTERWLRYYDRCGAESVDGTGFFRGDQEQLAGLERYLAGQDSISKPCQFSIWEREDVA